MDGCRPLTAAETQTVCNWYHGPWKLRNRALVIVGINTGYRVSELLSVRLRDVVAENNEMRDRITVQASNMKRGKHSRTVKLVPPAKEAVRQLVNELWDRGLRCRDTFLFCRSDGKPITRHRAWQLINTASKALKLPGKVATHSWRKTYVHRVHKELMRLAASGLEVDVLLETAALAGHADPRSTLSYLDSNSNIRDLVHASVAMRVQ